MTQQNAMELGDYIAILAKRKMSFFITAFLLLAIGVAIAFALPSVYRSEATILIERQEIPQDLVATTVTGYVQERIEGIRQRLVTHENMLEIAKKLDLFSDLREEGNTSEIVRTLRKNISIEMVDIKAGNSKNTATVAFTVGFEASEPKVAQKVAAELAERYLTVNRQSRSEQAAEVSQFLGQEANRLSEEITTLEKKLAKFKQKQSAQLPEMLQLNMRLFEKTEGQIETTIDRIRTVEDQIISIQSELSLTDPYKAVTSADGQIIQSPSERMNTLISDYLISSVRYAENHPDVVRLRREIQALGSQSPSAAKVSGLVSKITVLRAQLLDARQKYATGHPDVIRLESAVSELSNKLRNANVKDENDDPFVFDTPPDNPRYVSLKTRLDTTRSTLKSERAKLVKFRQKLRQYEKRLFQTPIVERDYQVLTRDYGNAKKKYTELRNKQLEARLAEELEANNKGERFVLEGKAYLPSTPDKPNRLGIILLAVLLAIGGGFAAMAIAEFRDDSIKGARGVKVIYGELPIVVIPYITTPLDASGRRKAFFIGLILSILVVVLAATAVHFLWYPLDILWLETMNR